MAEQHSNVSSDLIWEICRRRTLRVIHMQPALTHGNRRQQRLLGEAHIWWRGAVLEGSIESGEQTFEKGACRPHLYSVSKS